MSTVLMRHPTLPPEQEIEVDAQAVAHYASAGWLPVPDEELKARAAAAAKAAAKAVAAARAAEQAAADPAAEETAEPKTAPARRRATSTKEGE